MIYLGGITILSRSISWGGPDELRVPFESDHSDKLHQLYIGRRYMGQTGSPDERLLTCQYSPGRYGEHIWIVAVDGDDVGVDCGDRFPPRPYNVVRLTFDNESWTGDPHEVDVRKFDLHAGTEPGGAIDYDEILDSVVADGAKEYTLRSPPLGPSGEWNVGVRGVDTRETGGNAGTAEETAATVLAYPPDFDDEFEVAVAGAMATVTVTIPED